MLPKHRNDLSLVARNPNPRTRDPWLSWAEPKISWTGATKALLEESGLGPLGFREALYRGCYDG